MNLINFLFAIVITLLTVSCGNDTVTPATNINPGNDPNFTITAHSDSGLTKANRKVVVFGIDIYAAALVEDAKLLHAANVMAQYLDNDEDGTPDNQTVVDRMVSEKAFLTMWKSEDDLTEPSSGRIGQDLGNDETNPTYVTSGLTGRFDASLEEVLHIITAAGYALVYPEIFGETIGSELADAMDLARGGQFTSIPSTYPAGAWYTYDDTTCEYNCMVTEYHYWALTSILGAQQNRINDIEQEWKLNTSDKVENQDAAVFKLMTDPQYKFATVLPDGTYKR